MSEKRKVGRPKGSKSFVDVTLADLQNVAGPATVIPISRIWWEKMGGVVRKHEAPVAEETENHDPEAEDTMPAIEFVIE